MWLQGACLVGDEHTLWTHSGGFLVPQFQSHEKQVRHLQQRKHVQPYQSISIQRLIKNHWKTDHPHTDLSEILVSFLFSPATAHAQQPACGAGHRPFLAPLWHHSLRQALRGPRGPWEAEVVTFGVGLPQHGKALDALLPHQVTCWTWRDAWSASVARSSCINWGYISFGYFGSIPRNLFLKRTCAAEEDINCIWPRVEPIVPARWINNMILIAHTEAG